jgi:hypothetical protein
MPRTRPAVDSTLATLTVLLAAWAVLAAVVLASLAPLGALLAPGPGRPPAPVPALARGEARR